MKKLLVLSVLIFGFVLVACGAENDDTTDTETDAPEAIVEVDAEVSPSAYNEEMGETEELDNHAELMANGEAILSTINMLFPIENAFDVQVREDGTLLLIPDDQEWIDFQSAASDNVEIGDVITANLITLSEVIHDTFGIEGVQIILMMVGSDAIPMTTVVDGEIGINLFETTE